MASSTLDIVLTPATPEIEEDAPISQKLVMNLERLINDLKDCHKAAKLVERSSRARSKARRTVAGVSGIGEEEFAYIKEVNSNPFIKILPKLTDFLNMHSDTPVVNNTVRRKEITRIVHNYIKSSELVNPLAKRSLFLDSALAALFSKPVGTEVTWFQVHSLMNPLFDRSDEAVAENKRMRTENVEQARTEYAKIKARGNTQAAPPAPVVTTEVSESQAAPSTTTNEAEPAKKKARTKKAAAVATA